MKIHQSNIKKKVLIIIGLLILLIAAVIGTMAYSKTGPFTQTNHTSSQETKPSTDPEAKTGQDIKKQSVDTQGQDKPNSGSDPLPAPKPIENSNKSSVGMQISSANQDESTLYVRALIQAITSTGACTLSMSGPNGKTYSATADIQSLPGSSTCKGFNIPLTALAPGDWNTTVSFTNDDLSASAAKTMTVK